nr:GNAT family N-acetyltransferase [uncultured Desulfobacter sp.]
MGLKSLAPQLPVGRKNPNEMVMTIIRNATKSDINSIVAIHAESWRNTYSDELPSKFLTEQLDKEFERHWNEIQIKNEDIVLVAEKDSIVGFVAVWCHPIPFIDNLHVTTSQRSKNIGSTLMKAVANELMKKKHNTAYLWVFESNKKAIRFYERLGGVQAQQTMKNVFGYDVLCRKIEWNNLSTILEHT